MARRAPRSTTEHHAILGPASDTDLIVMGTQFAAGSRHLVGTVIREVLARRETPVILIGSRRARPILPA